MVASFPVFSHLFGKYIYVSLRNFENFIALSCQIFVTDPILSCYIRKSFLKLNLSFAELMEGMQPFIMVHGLIKRRLIDSDL